MIEDWKIKDNLIIALNAFNKSFIKNGEHHEKNLFRIYEIKKKCRAYSKKYKVSLLESSAIIKNMAQNSLHKNKYDVCL